GPMASGANARSHPQVVAQTGTSRIVTIVSRNPRQVWSVSAVPTYSWGATSVTSAENCAESATIDTPQTNVTATTNRSGPFTRAPTVRAQTPLTAMATMVTGARPAWSAALPA